METSERVLALSWCIQWTIAFPTLLPTRPWLLNDDEDEDDDDWQDPLAWQVLWERGDHLQRTRESSNEATIWKDSLGYGEIEASTIFDVLKILESRTDFSPRCIVDLGSGNGKVLMAAALRTSRKNFVNAIGLEIVPSLHQAALNNHVDCWEAYDVPGLTRVQFQLACADITVETEWIQSADLVLLHATVFEDALMQTVCELCHQTSPGTYFVSVSRPIADMDVVYELQAFMSWGRGTINLQRNTASND